MVSIQNISTTLKVWWRYFIPPSSSFIVYNKNINPTKQ